MITDVCALGMKAFGKSKMADKDLGGFIPVLRQKNLSEVTTTKSFVVPLYRLIVLVYCCINKLLSSSFQIRPYSGIVSALRSLES
jgi:hypothetical protein